jgi:hypothetical protein
MVQWFKQLLARFRVTKQRATLIEFNQDKLTKKLERLALAAYRTRNEDSMKLIRELLETERALHLLSLNGSAELTPVKVARVQGRIEAVNSITNFLDLSQDESAYRSLKQRLDPATKTRTVKLKPTSTAEAVM